MTIAFHALMSQHRFEYLKEFLQFVYFTHAL